MTAREHLLSAGCWCGPVVGEVPNTWAGTIFSLSRSRMGLDYVQPSADYRRFRVVMAGSPVVELSRHEARMLARRLTQALGRRPR